MSEILEIKSPLDAEVVERLTAGTQVLISGVIYTGRDAAHKRLVAALDAGEELPFDLRGQTIYYVGPSPARAHRQTPGYGTAGCCRLPRRWPVAPGRSPYPVP